MDIARPVSVNGFVLDGFFPRNSLPRDINAQHTVKMSLKHRTVVSSVLQINNTMSDRGRFNLGWTVLSRTPWPLCCRIGYEPFVAQFVESSWYLGHKLIEPAHLYTFLLFVQQLSFQFLYFLSAKWLVQTGVYTSESRPRARMHKQS